MIILLLTAVFLQAGLQAGARAQNPLRPPEAAASLRKIFGDSVRTTTRTVRITRSFADSIASVTKSRWDSDTIEVVECSMRDSTIGYGFVDNVKGKTQFITYLAALRTDGTVADIDVLKYRESYGGEIAYESFRKQFRQKNAVDRLQPGADIKNISGATISVRAISSGVRRILLTFGHILPQLHNRL